MKQSVRSLCATFNNDDGWERTSCCSCLHIHDRKLVDDGRRVRGGMKAGVGRLVGDERGRSS
jgi:protein-arginine kinase activator protein McsA